MNAAEELLAPAIAGGLGESPAILFGDTTVTYADLEADSNRYAGALCALGVARQDRVLMLLGDRPVFFGVYLGVLKAGAVAVALDLRISAADLLFAVNDSACRVLILDWEFVSLYERVVADVAAPPAVVVAGGRAVGYRTLDEVTEGCATTFEPNAMAPGDMAFWMYTSGTTGKPKAVIHRQSAVRAADRFLGRVLGVGPGDRLYCTSKLFFAYSLGHCFFGALRLGAAAILMDDWPTPGSVARVVERHRPTVVLSVPIFYRNLLDDGAAGGPAFDAVRHYVSAGEKLPAPLFERWRAVTGVPIVEGIGATETCFLFVANRGDEQRPGSCGRALPETEVRLLDDTGAPVDAPGMPGILWVRADCLADGYWRQDEKTGAAFKDGWYCTGDVFTRDAEGWYYHQGRTDDMLKISGQWVSPSEIEAQVLADPRITDAAVVGSPDRDGLVRLALFVVAPGADPGSLEGEIQEALLANLSVYKCPRRIYFIEELPRTASGKVQRFMLRDMAGDLAVGRG